MIDYTNLKTQQNMSFVINKMREFFLSREFLEVYPQGNLSILAACEDPETIAEFTFQDNKWPLPQTNQMNLEYILLKNPKLKGVFCTTTSYRNEMFPIEGRHDLIFPMFEFESFGNVLDLIALEIELLKHLGFNYISIQGTYGYFCGFYSGMHIKEDNIITPEIEDEISIDFGNIVFIRNFPQHSHPFWNMKKNDDGTYAKIDFILYGMETIGSAERSCYPYEMWENFHSVSDGKYARLLFDLFGKDNVLHELDNYLALPMLPRFGAGIGITRMVRAMKLAGLL